MISITEALTPRRLTISLVVLLHKHEGVMVEIAVEVNVRLDPPVPAILEHQRVPEEETRVEATHVPVGDASSIDNVVLDHLRSRSAGTGFINEVRLEPVVVGDDAELDFGRCEVGYPLLEIVGEGHLVQENVGISVVPVEPIFVFPNAPRNGVQVTFPAQNDEGCVGALFR